EEQHQGDRLRQSIDPHSGTRFGTLRISTNGYQKHGDIGYGREEKHRSLTPRELRPVATAPSPARAAARHRDQRTGDPPCALATTTELMSCALFDCS
ncbi:hypothetical protein Dimus_011244, partial [Dionaea muscipula]